jgi:hypothetical protein
MLLFRQLNTRIPSFPRTPDRGPGQERESGKKGDGFPFPDPSRGQVSRETLDADQACPQLDRGSGMTFFMYLPGGVIESSY